MTNFKIVFLYNDYDSDDKSHVFIDKKIYLIQINVFDICNYRLNKEIDKINNLIKLNDKINMVSIIFDEKIGCQLINRIITKLNNILYSYDRLKLVIEFMKKYKINYKEIKNYLNKI